VDRLDYTSLFRFESLQLPKIDLRFPIRRLRSFEGLIPFHRFTEFPLRESPAPSPSSGPLPDFVRNALPSIGTTRDEVDADTAKAAMNGTITRAKCGNQRGRIRAGM